MVGASAVFLELQAALRRLWGAEAPTAGLRGLVIGRLTGFALALAGFLLRHHADGRGGDERRAGLVRRGPRLVRALAGAVDLLLVNAASAALFALLLARLAPAAQGIAGATRCRRRPSSPACSRWGATLIALYLARTGVASAWRRRLAGGDPGVDILVGADLPVRRHRVLRVQQPDAGSA